MSFANRICSFDAATGCQCEDRPMGDYQRAQAVELVRALCHQLHKTTTRLDQVERQGVKHARFETSQIRDFVPLLVEKCARRELKRKPSISPVGVYL